MIALSQILQFVLLIAVVRTHSSSSSSRSSSVQNPIDISLHHYNQNGEISQMNYAFQAVQKSDIRVLGFSQNDFSIVFILKKKTSKLLIASCRPMIEIYSKTLGIIMSGTLADSEYTRKQCNLLKQIHILKFGETPYIKAMAKLLSRWLTRGMYIGDEDAILRPIATSVLLFGRDLIDDIHSHRLVLVENTGSVVTCDFAYIGPSLTGVETLTKIKEELNRTMVYGENDEGGMLRGELRRRILNVARIIFESEGNEEEEEKDITAVTAINYVEDHGIDIECSVCDKHGISLSESFSTTQQLLGLMENGWLADSE